MGSKRPTHSRWSSFRRLAGVAAAGTLVLAVAAAAGDAPAGRRAAVSQGYTSTEFAAGSHGYTSTEFATAPSAGEASSSATAPTPRSASQATLSTILAEPGHHTHVGPRGQVDVTVCSDAVPPGYAHCNAHIRTDAAANGGPNRPNAATPAAGTVGNGGAYDPAYLQSAYNAPSATGGSGQTVAIVDAYDNPKAESDLAYYRSHFNLPPCTTANGCFRKVDQNGGVSYPSADVGWAQEIALDLQMVSALCPNCKILLVEAQDSYLNNLGAAVNTAVNLFHANAVSNSYGAGEYNGEGSDGATWFNHPGVAVTASSGDNGYGVEFPAASRYVTAVGGTNLVQNTNTGTRNGSETAWSGAGSGCSGYEPKPVWQHDTGCAKRTVADVSAVADPNTGVWVYITYGSNPGWWIFGGTSVAAPIVGAIYALAGNGSTPDTLSSYPYGTVGGLNDVTSGSNGTCGVAYLCKGGVGYDGPTGLGTPNGTPSFSPAAPPAPTVPGSPQGVQAAGADGTVTLSWSPPASNGGSSITSYNVYRGTAAGAETLLGTAGTATSFVDSGLTNGTTYYYQVSALNSQGEGSRSTEVSGFPAVLTVPSAPQSASAVAGNAKITVSWTAPASNGGSTVTSYRLYRGTSPGGEGATAYASGLTGTNYADASVTAGTRYYYVVTAVNAQGESVRSAEASATAVTVPGTVSSLVAKSASPRGIKLTWTAPSNGGLSITGYRIYRSRSSGTQSYYVTVTCTTASCAYTDTNTSRFLVYYYRVAATNAVGTAALSNRASARAN